MSINNIRFKQTFITVSRGRWKALDKSIEALTEDPVCAIFYSFLLALHLSIRSHTVLLLKSIEHKRTNEITVSTWHRLLQIIQYFFFVSLSNRAVCL